MLSCTYKKNCALPNKRKILIATEPKHIWNFTEQRKVPRFLRRTEQNERRYFWRKASEKISLLTKKEKWQWNITATILRRWKQEITLFNYPFTRNAILRFFFFFFFLKIYFCYIRVVMKKKKKNIKRQFETKCTWGKRTLEKMRAENLLISSTISL